MADELNTAPVLSVYATIDSKLDEFVQKDGQLIFVKDKQMIALDLDGKRKIYNQIEELATEAARTSLLAPVSGRYYFVIDPPVLWRYQENGWIQITTPPDSLEAVQQEVRDYIDTKVVTLNSAISGKADSSHSHDDRYYTESEVDEKIDEVSSTLVDLSTTTSTNYDESIIGLSIDGQTITYVKGDGSVHTLITQDTNTEYFLGTDETTGLTKLYATVGDAEDGTMTQKAIKTELDKKVGVAVDDTQDMLIFTK